MGYYDYLFMANWEFEDERAIGTYFLEGEDKGEWWVGD